MAYGERVLVRWRSHCTRVRARRECCAAAAPAPRFNLLTAAATRTNGSAETSPATGCAQTSRDLLRLPHSPMLACKPAPQPISASPPSKLKKPNWLFQLPFTPAGVKGRGGSGGQTKANACFSSENYGPCGRVCAASPAMQMRRRCHCFGCAWRARRRR